MRILTIFLQASPDFISPIFMVLFFAIIYFFMIRPQMKKQKEEQAFAESIEKGDEVVTSSGIIGQVNKIEGAIITLKVDNKTHIRVVRGAISKEMTEQVSKAAANE